MSDLIKKLYYGQLYPLERCGIHSNKIKQLSRKIEEKREEIKNILSEQKELLEEYEELLSSLSSEYYEMHFVEGFKTGARITAEALIDNEK